MELKWERARELRNGATDAERHLWRYLRREQLAVWKFRRQYPIAGFIADFVCIPARLVVELDGGQHADTCGYDASRTRLVEAEGIGWCASGMTRRCCAWMPCWRRFSGI